MSLRAILPYYHPGSESQDTVRIAMRLIATIYSALFFILEMEEPFHGLLTVSEDAMRFAYAHLNR